MSDIKSNTKYKRNFSIIAHIDHGKSTLADRILEFTNTVSKREMKEQLLDSMDLEREKGITIKAQAVTIKYRAKDNHDYELNLIDTPGHVDFTYEVSRSLSACDGALLVVDATQGVEAQTLANVYLALENDLFIVPVINKIDLPSAEPERIKKEIEDSIGIDVTSAVLTSAKTGIGIGDLLEAVVKYIPAPKVDSYDSLKALIFDSHFNDYKGVIVYVRIMDGTVKAGDKILFMATGKTFIVDEVGIFTPTMKPIDRLEPGSVGYIIAGIKSVKDARAGDTLTLAANPIEVPLKGYKPIKPMMFAGIYPIDAENYTKLREAIEKIQLNDPSLVFEPEKSDALGFGYRMGFLGLLHMEIIIERLRREHNMDIISTAPSVSYKIDLTSGNTVYIDNPAKWPSPQETKDMFEPIMACTVVVPKDYVGVTMDLCTKKRGRYIEMKYLDDKRVILKYDLPLAEIVMDFYDKLKSLTKGYATFEYELIGYEESNLVKVDLLVAGESVDALSFISHKSNSYYRSKEIVEKLKDIIPRHMFEVPLQAVIGNKVIARETLGAMRKNVLAKCYGGDITRKKKLLEKQKEGKKKMKAIGRVSIPQDAFLTILKLD